ncbi:MAG: LexA family transcriptional regulator [Phycisphaeraceae bacterium]|nr:LexA family transcriptional regulator [Phycisphaeraceae bacterium]
MAHFGNRIRAARAERGWSQDDLAQRSGLHANTIRKIERTIAEPGDLKESTRLCLAHGLGVTVKELDALYQPAVVPQQQGDPNGGIPVINRAPAGGPVDYEHMSLDAGVGWDYVPRIGSGVHDPTAFAFVVVGDSMMPEFHEGDTVICSPQAAIRDGDAVFVRLGAERDSTCTFKRVFNRGLSVELIPDNRRYPPMLVLKEHIVRMSKVVAKWVRYD